MSRKDLITSWDDFSGGLNDDVSPLNAKENQVTDVLNMDFTDTGAITKRLGFTGYNAIALQGQPVSGTEFDRSNGDRWFLTQINETAKDTGAGTELRSVMWYTTGNGVFVPCAWFNVGTATFTNGSPTVTLTGTGVTNAEQNMPTATEFWVRGDEQSGGGTPDTSWYTVASVSGNVLTLDRNFEGDSGGGQSYEIVRTMITGLAANYEQYKDNVLIFQKATRPMRFDGTNCHFLENIRPITDPTFANGGVGNVPSGDRHIVAVYEYGPLGPSAPSVGQIINFGNNRTIDLSTLPTGPQGVVNIEIYVTEFGGASTDPHYFIDEAANGASTPILDFYNIDDAQLIQNELLQQDLGAVDQGSTAPVNGSIPKIIDDRLFLVDTENNPSLISVSKPFFPGLHPSANTITVSTEDGQIISGLTESFGKLVILKDLSSQYYLTINRPETSVEKIPTDLGCVSHNSIARWRQWFIYMSTRGVAIGSIQGGRIISRDITNSITGLKQALQRSAYKFLTTQTELSAGATLVNTSVSTDGDIQIDKQSVSDTTEADFDLGTHLNTEAGVEPEDASVQAGVTIEAESTVNRRFKMRNLARDRTGDGGAQTVKGLLSFTPIGTVSNAVDGSFGTRWVSDAEPVAGFVAGFVSHNLSPASRQICRVNAYFSVNSLQAHSPLGSIRIRVQVRIATIWTDVDSLAGFETITIFSEGGVLQGDGKPINGGTVIYRFDNSLATSLVIMSSNFAPVSATEVRVLFDELSGPIPMTSFVVSITELKTYEAGFKLSTISGSGSSRTAQSIFTSREFDLGNANVSLGTVDVTAETLFYGDNDRYSDESDYGGDLTSLDAGNGPTAMALSRGGAGFNIQVRSSATTPIPPATPWVDQISGGIFEGTFNRYIQYRILFENSGFVSTKGYVLQSRPSGASLIKDVTINYFPQGTYESATIDAAEIPQRMGRIIFDSTTNGGTIQASVETRAADSGWGTFTNFSSGDLITLTPRRFMRVKFVLDGASSKSSAVNLSPIVSSFRIEWFSVDTQQSALPITGKVFNDIYYLSGERPQSTFNDRTYIADLRPLVRNQDPPWTVYDFAMNGFIVTGNTFYGIPSNGTTVFALLDGYDDDGTAIQSFAVLPPRLNGPNMKIFKKSFIEADRANGSVNNNISYMPMGDFVGWETITVDLNTEIPFGGPYSGVEISGDLTFPGTIIKWKTGPMGYTAGFGFRQVEGAFSRDARLSHRGTHIFFKIFNNLKNTKVIKVHRVDVVYQPKNLRGASV